MKKFFLTGAVLLLAVVGCLNAQEAVARIHLSTGSTNSITLGTSGGIYFDGTDDLTVVSNEGVSSTFTMDAIAYVDFEETTTGITAAATTVTFYPNPSKGLIHLQGIGDTPQSVVVYNLMGARVLEQTVSEGKVLNLTSLPDGVYLVRIGNNIIKVVKQQ